MVARVGLGMVGGGDGGMDSEEMDRAVSTSMGGRGTGGGFGRVDGTRGTVGVGVGVGVALLARTGLSRRPL